MIRAQFETATIADAIKKAAKVAPTKGAALDKAAGIVMELDPTEPEQVTIRSTNLDVYYLEVVSAISVAVKEHEIWRFPALVLAGVMGSLPIGTDAACTFTYSEGAVTIQQGRTTAKLRLIDASYYPDWKPFDPSTLEPVEDLGARFAAIEWAAANRGEPPLIGVHCNGSTLVATDRYRLASIPCSVPLLHPVTVPAGILGNVLRAKGDVKVGATEEMFLLMPDEGTQIKTVIFDTKYPNLDHVFNREPPNQVILRKQSVIDVINRAVVLNAHERVPTLKLWLGKEELAVMCSDDEIGLLGDVLDTPGYCTHARTQFIFTPRNLTDALASAPSEQVTLHYDSTDPTKPFKIDGGSGYVAVVMPRKASESDE